MSDTMIEVRDLTRFYGPNKALDTIHLNVKRGEVVGFLGPNGAGKTTTMRILAGLLAPSEGSVQVAGIDVVENPLEARAKIGYLPETPPLYDEMTVREYLFYLAALRGVSRRSRQDAVEHAMTRCGVTDVSDRLLRNLSKGYRQRVAIAQAIVHSPDVVILDEPTVGLDPIQIREIRTLIQEIGGEHSVLLSTHILPEVQMTCHRAVVINRGAIVAEGSLEALEQRARHQNVVKIRWGKAPTETVLRGFSTIAEARYEKPYWIITPEKGVDPLPELIRQSVSESSTWGDLREIIPMTRGLEDIFIQLAIEETETETETEVKERLPV